MKAKDILGILFGLFLIVLIISFGISFIYSVVFIGVIILTLLNGLLMDRIIEKEFGSKVNFTFMDKVRKLAIDMLFTSKYSDKYRLEVIILRVAVIAFLVIFLYSFFY